MPAQFNTFRTVRRRACALALAAFAVGAFATLGPAAGDATTFSVSSSLAGKVVVPIRSHWFGSTDLPPSQLDRVEFVIDGTVRWIEHDAPYNYASDHKGRDRGWLVTTWLSPGRHRFVVRIFDKSGQSAEAGVTARVVASPIAPSVLTRGTWQRVDRPSELLWFDRVGITHAGADGTGVIHDYEITGRTLNVYGVVVAGVQEIDHGTCTGNGCKKVRRLGRTFEVAGNDCSYAGPFGRYQWSVKGDQLTLKIIHEGCRGRGGFLAHTWKRGP
jgi:hypothetical protein